MKRIINNVLVLSIGLTSLSISFVPRLTWAQTYSQQETVQLIQQANHQFSLGKHQQALEILKQVLTITKENNDKKLEGIIFNNIGAIYDAIGQPEEALKYYYQALPIYKEIQDRKQEGTTLNNIGLAYKLTGQLQDALKYYNLALPIRREQEDFKGEAITLSNIGTIYDDMGQYQDALRYQNQALDIQKEIEDRRGEAITRVNIGIIYSRIGQKQKALNYYQQALPIFKQENVQFERASTLNTIGTIYDDMGQDREALRYYKQALDIQKEIEDRRGKAITLNNIGTIYDDMGQDREALRYYKQALDVQKEIKDRRGKAITLNNIGFLYRKIGQKQEALNYYQQSLPIFREIGNRNGEAKSLSNLSINYADLGQYDKAITLAKQGNEIEEQSLSSNLLIGSEQDKRTYIKQFQTSTNVNISLHLQNIPNNLEAGRLALRLILQRKGRVLDVMGNSFQNLRENGTLAEQKLFARLAATQSQLSALVSKGLGKNEGAIEQYQTKLDDLEQEINKLESELSNRSQAFALETTPVTIEKLQQEIPADAVLLEYVKYSPFNAKGTISEEAWGEARYAVYILHSQGQPQWVDLGAAKEIEPFIEKYRKYLSSNASRASIIVEQTETSIQEQLELMRSTARQLDRLLVQPVRQKMGNAQHLLISPDSSLNLIPFGALIDEEDRYLLSTYQISYLSSGRDLLRFKISRSSQQNPLMLANPNYDSANPQVHLAKNSNNLNVDKIRSQRSQDLSTIQVNPLPGTAIEGEAIAQIIPGLNLLTKSDATENALKQAESPQLLHIATHGFFLKDEPMPLSAPGAEDSQPLRIENPLLRSGLALAGFNQRKSGTEDGVLTALEVTSLNLRGTQLVVLSACDTGLGDLVQGEGVYGLRRAFTLAGAESQLMSLWKVDDSATKDLMVKYYKRIQRGQGRAEALRQVQLEMMQQPDTQYPYYWAAFIPAGDWSPLEQ